VNNPDAIIAELGDVEHEQIPAVLTALALVQARLAARLMTQQAVTNHVQATDENLTIEEAAKKLRKSTRWIYRQIKLKRLLFVHKISERSYVVSLRELEKWLAQRQR
jgi:predicted DNA-binding transcriptional regulator AlpA